MRKLLTMTCPPNQHEHKGVCCNKCPKGKHLSAHCNQSQPTCTQCPVGHFTETDNFLPNCLRCGQCDSSHHLQPSKPCTADSNTKCMCIEGFYCTTLSKEHEDDCKQCEPLSSCPPGEGVSIPPNSTHNTVCKPCPAGTFNNQSDYHSLCRTHASCSNLGRSLISGGTTKTDAICGDLIPRCHWMIPASLWVGLIVTIILFVIVVVCLKTRRRRTAAITSVSLENFVLPALPPDVIKYPKSQELQTLTHNNKRCPEEDDCCGLECDGVSVNRLSKEPADFSIPDTCTSFISEPYKSEPQEDDWPGL